MERDHARPPAGKREQNKKANREAILAAALTVFWERGYDGVTIRDVIRATHLAAGTFYNYFPDKKSLFAAVMEERILALTQRLTQVRRAATDMRQFLHEAYLTVFEEIDAHPRFYSMMFRNEPVIRALFADNIFGISLRALRSDLRHAANRGLLPAHDFELMSALLFGAGFEMARLLVGRKSRDPRAAAEFASRLFLEGLGSLGATTTLVRQGPITLGGNAR